MSLTPTTIQAILDATAHGKPVTLIGTKSSAPRLIHMSTPRSSKSYMRDHLSLLNDKSIKRIAVRGAKAKHMFIDEAPAEKAEVERSYRTYLFRPTLLCLLIREAIGLSGERVQS